MTLLDATQHRNLSMDLQPNVSTSGPFQQGIYTAHTSQLNGGLLLPWVKLIGYVAVILFGVVVNMFVLIAYVRKLKKSTYIFVVALSICDLLNCIGLTAELVRVVVNIELEELKLFCLIRTYFTHFGILTSAGLVLCIAIDRYLRVKYPHVTLYPKHCVVLILGILGTVLLVTSPYVIVYASKMVYSYVNCLEFATKRTTEQSTEKSMDISLVGIHGRKLFLKSFYGVLAICLSLVFLSVVILYIKLAVIIRRKTQTRVPKLCVSAENSDGILWVDDIPTSMVDSKPHKSRWQEFRKDQVSFTNDLSAIVRNNSFKKTVYAQTASNVMTSTPKSSAGRDHVILKLKRREESPRQRRSLTPSIVSFFSPRTFTRTFIMLILSVVMFLFYFPNLVLHVISVDQMHVLVGNPVTSELLLHSQIVCFILNPIVFAYLNRGFWTKVRRCCCSGGLKV